MEEISQIPSTVYCDHCSKNVSRATAKRHKKRTTTDLPEDFLFKDLNRRKRCLPSSDEEEDDDLLDNSEQEEQIDYFDPDPQLEEALLESDENEEDNADEQYWDDEDEVQVQRDLADPQQKDQVSEGVQQMNQSLLEKANRVTQWVVNSLLVIQCKHFLPNVVLELLLVLFYQLFAFLSKTCTLCAVILKIFPQSLYTMYKYLGFDRDDFTKYIVCQNCCAIYKYDEVIYQSNGRWFAKVCSNAVFGCRTATQATRKKGKYKCGAALVREVQLSSGKHVFYPLKVYCYRGIINSLEAFLKRPGFVQMCQEWRERKVRERTFADVYDGNVWKDFAQEEHFFGGKFNFGAMLNVDWFQPFKRRRDFSVGALYLTIMNVPRERRFKRENTILVGIIPALHKEPENLNSFLKPVSNELKALWKGVKLEVFGENEKQTVKMALLCAAADIPAARKLLGFMGHSAKQGCSHCKKVFHEGGEKCYGGFDVNSWQSRSKAEHIMYTSKSEKAPNLTTKKEIEKTHGYKYTTLLELAYFQPTRFCAIDPMHNLFLGTAKKIFDFWVDKGILGKKQLDEITDRIITLKVPSDVGRIPSNISTNHGTFTAKEWKNWVLVYSVVALKGLIPIDDMRLWQTFVQACRHLCQPCINHVNLEIAHGLLVKFCKGIESHYGSSFITPNMHLHCHLRETVRNFGSVYGFWLFGFERFNGMLTDLPNNKRSIEMQLMRKFLLMGYVDDVKFRDCGEFQNEFSKLCSLPEEEVVASKSNQNLLMAPVDQLREIPVCVWCDLSLCSVQHEGYKLYALGSQERERLRQMYSCLYGKAIALESLTNCCKLYGSVRYNNELLGSTMYSRTDTSRVLVARWADDNGDITERGELRPGMVRYYLQHNLDDSTGKVINHMIAVIDWYKPLENNYGFLPPVSVWSTKQQNDGPAMFIPVQRVAGRCAWKKEKVPGTTILVACPIIPHTFI